MWYMDYVAKKVCEISISLFKIVMSMLFFENLFVLLFSLVVPSKNYGIIIIL